VERIVGGRRVSWVIVLVWTAACVQQSEPDSTEPVHGQLTGFTGVLTQHNDLARTGANLNEVLLTTSNVARGSFGKVAALAVDGQIYGQPLYVPAAIGGANVVFVATENNKVYAYHADSPWEKIWERDLEAPWNPVSPTCGNSVKPYGINSTPVIDPAASTIYVVVRTATAGVPQHLLHALNLTTGAEKLAGPLDMGKTAAGAQLSVPGKGLGSTGGTSSTLPFDPLIHQNRVALTLSPSGVLSVGFGSYCDHDNFHGWLLRFDTATSPITRLTPYVTTPNTSRGSLWMGGAGFADDGTGAIYFMSGNGPASGTVTDGTSLGDAFVKLTGTTTPSAAPVVSSWFMPSDVAALDAGDTDVGSSGPLLIPGTHLILGGGKGGILYLVNRDTMGGFKAGTPPDTQIVQRFAASAGQWIVGSPIFWNRPGAGMMYLWPGKTPLEQYAFDATAGKFTPAAAPVPVFKSTVNPALDPQGGNLALSANGSTSGTGIVWGTQPLAGAGGGAAVMGALYAFNAENVSQELWDSTMVAGDKLMSYAKYTAPTVANGKVYVSTFSGEVDVYGLLGTPPVDAGIRDAGAAPMVLTCATVDGGAAQPTTWSYVYNTYFAGTGPSDGGAGTLGHCAKCHGTVPQGGFLSGTDKDHFYSGLVAINQINPDAGASSAFAVPDASPLAWFGVRSTTGNIFALMPQDYLPSQVPNPRAVAAVCGWVKAGAINDVVCPSPQVACNNQCFDLSGSSAHCGTCAVSCTTGTTCLAGVCCATGFVNCGGACVNLTANPNCGACGVTCGTGLTCSKKTCLANNGQTCSTGTQCVSGSCVDGVCCGSASCATCMACSNAKTGAVSGTCAPILTGQVDTRCTKAPPCGLDGTCNGAGACRNALSGTSCGTATCASGIAQPTATCNGGGTCTTPPTVACTPYLCGTTACATTCTSNANCATGAQCSGGVCSPCPGGLCCSTGQVNCSGVCVTTTSDVNNCGGCGIKCTAPTAGTTSCAAGVCKPTCSAGATLCGGACVALTANPNCGACGVTCAAGSTCTSSKCVKSNGQTCAAGTECATGSCVDGVCCASASCATCMACSNAKTGAASGTCAPILAGQADTRCTKAPPCGLDGTCNGAGACRNAVSGTNCGAATCASGIAQPASTCNGGGTCTTPTTVACTPFVCGTTACATTCTINANCATGAQCSGGVCSLCPGGLCCTTGQVNCSGVCVTTSGDANNCGGCAIKCTAPTGGTTSCAAGVCKPACSAGATLCGTACVTTATDVNNCGGCGVTCAIGASCTAGTCGAAACTTTNALIDDFEDGNNLISVREGRNGADYTYADTTGSTITPTAGSTFVPGTPGNGTSTRAAHFNGTLSGATTVWAGMGMDFLAPKGVYNASKYTGISFFAKKGSTTTNGAVRVKVPDRNTDPTGAICTSCSNDFGVDLTLTTTWTKYTIPFSGMTQQAGWGAPRPAEIDPTGVVAVQFQVGITGQVYDIWVDDVTFTCN
jgi:hypothetical protein